MRPLRIMAASVGTLLLILFFRPLYGKWSLLVILPIGLLLLFLAARSRAATVAKQEPVREPRAAPIAATMSGNPATVSEVLAELAVALKKGGGQAATDQAEKRRHQLTRCGDCGTNFVLTEGMTFGHPPAHRAAPGTNREKLYGYTIECPACNKGGFVGKPI